jgi:phage recombination protein Bet
MNAIAKVVPTASRSVLVRMGDRFGVDPEKMMSTLKATCFKQRKDDPEVSNEEMMALMVVADQYKLNPFTKEIYAFSDKKRGGIVPVVSVDGWARIINEHPQLDGIEFSYSPETIEHKKKTCHEWIDCIMSRKDRSKPTIVREFFAEVVRSANFETPWDTHPNRMHRHKALIQCARVAFGFAGIYDPDEAERIIEAQVVEDRKVDPRPDTSQVDMTKADRYVSAIADIIAADKEEHEIGQMLRDLNQELSEWPDLATVVFDRMAKQGVLTKKAYRDWMAIKAPESN